MNSLAPAFWNTLDGIAVVNLDRRTERWARLLSEAANLGMPKLTRISAIPGEALPGFGKRPWFRGGRRDRQWAGRVGCTLSHRKVMAHARQQGWKNFLILEDDACLAELIDFDLSHLAEVLFARHADWGVCYLGCSKAVGKALEVCGVNGRMLCQIPGCYTTHAYLVREAARDWIIKQLPDESSAWRWHARHRCVDRWYSRQLARFHRTYAITPSLITQHAGFSDVVLREVDYDQEFVGGVDNSTHSRAMFRLHSCLRGMSREFADFYDCCRGFGKRIGGF